MKIEPGTNIIFNDTNQRYHVRYITVVITEGPPETVLTCQPEMRSGVTEFKLSKLAPAIAAGDVEILNG
jgi:hypothetical protein